MIIDNIENWNLYFSGKSPLYPGIAFINERACENIADGRYEIKGDGIFAMVQSYHTEAYENKRIENHRKYIDIQYIIAGQEIIGWIPSKGLAVKTPYVEESDVAFYHDTYNCSLFVLKGGMFAVFYTDDARMLV